MTSTEDDVTRPRPRIDRTVCMRRTTIICTLIFSGLLLTNLVGCSDDDDDDSRANQAQLFPQDGLLKASIRRTTNGVPHIRADNLASAAFGSGYAQAQDNVCLLAENFVKARSERALYFGPGPDNANIISDFSYKAQDIRSGAEAEFEQLTPESRALTEGFTAGYNRYVRETDPSTLPEACRNQPWVKPITPIDLYAHYRIVGQYASGAVFATGAVFVATPPGVSAEPRIIADTSTPGSSTAVRLMPAYEVAPAAARAVREQGADLDTGLASNAWGIGSEMSEQGKGALLANPHFPYTGSRRLYQVHMTVPGYLDMNGAGLMGTAIPLINFNQNLAWSHTVTTSSQFTLYTLSLKPGDPMTYIKDGQEKPITSKTFRIQVNNGTAVPTELEHTMYFSEYGPMVAADLVTDGGLPAWGSSNLAYTYRDANAQTTKLLDSWLQMSQASDLDSFKAVFRECGSTFWTNTIYADDQGNAFYIDSSSTPNLSAAAKDALNAKRAASPIFASLFNNGLILLDGSNSRDDWVEGQCRGLVPFEDKPMLQRQDFVQNSNDSYWATNPAQFLTGYSPLFGPEQVPLNARTRIGLKMLQNPLDPGFAAAPPAGQDGKFSSTDLIEVIYNNRSFYAELLLPELLERCALIGSMPVDTSTEETPGTSRAVDSACAVLAGWDGVYDSASVGAHVFRVFIGQYRNALPADFTTAFNTADPVGTPADPSAEARGTSDDLMLISLARGLDSLDSASIAYNVPLGSVQYYQPSGGVPPGGTAQDLLQSFPWHGGDGGVDGVFNAIGVVDSAVAEDTRFPRVSPPVIDDTAGLAKSPGVGWRIARGTSWHFGLEFTDTGPEAYGLLSYAQSTDPASPWFNDQSLRYSEKDYRKLLFTEADIQANLIPEASVELTEPLNRL
ncbi:penicillin acylase family protein [Allohahella marinimesophila]|uniref:Acylase n=1 Tax=Allohahella marinimesophila TaxID=1054972 RepID=A0ABP7P0C9_9GAMM